MVNLKERASDVSQKILDEPGLGCGFKRGQAWQEESDGTDH